MSMRMAWTPNLPSGNEEGAAALITPFLRNFQAKPSTPLHPKFALQILFATLGFRVQFWVARMYLGVAPYKIVIFG
jgi:hypothetical protein